MKREFSFIGGGKVPSDISVAIRNAVYEAMGQHLVLTLRKKKKFRSDKQNRYYFGVVIPAIMQVFYNAGDVIDTEYAHDFAKMEIGNIKKKSHLTGLWMPDTSTDLSTTQWEDWMILCRKWCAENNIDVSEPNE